MTKWIARLTPALALGWAGAGALAQGRTPPPVNDTALVVYDLDGLRIHSANRRQQLRLRAYVVAEARAALDDTADASASGFDIRRARVTFDANLYPQVAVRLMFDAGPTSGPTTIEDAYMDVGLRGSWWVRAGRQKTPSGLERYMSISSELLPERSVASNLNASRDEGILLTGEVVPRYVEVSLGAFNGAPDGGMSSEVDPNDGKDLTYRVWFKPRRTMRGTIEQGWGFAYNGSTGMERSPAAGGTRLPVFKTPAIVPFFAYAERQGVRADGRHTRNGAFAYYHGGPIGLMAEWFSNSQVVARSGTTATVRTGAWLANVQYTVTGEPSAQEGINPKAEFDPEKGHWGAWQIGARVAGVSVARSAFPFFADPASSARSALEVGAGINWYLTRQTKVQLAYEHTAFRGGAPFGDRRAERYVQFRWQGYF